MKREKMIAFIRKHGVTESNGKLHKFYELVDFSGHSDEEIKVIFKRTEKELIERGRKDMNDIVKFVNYKRKK